MLLVRKIALNATKLKQKQREIFFNVVKQGEVKRFVLDLNRYNQLFKQGKDAEGDIIGFYSAYTEMINTGQSFTFKGETKTKVQGKPIFLVDSGDFFDTFTVKVDKSGITILADPMKDNGTNLLAKFGKIIGLNDESITLLAQYILPKVIRETSKQIFTA